MGDLVANEGLGNKVDAVNGDGAEDFTPNGTLEKTKTNGMDSTPQKSTTEKANTPKQTAPKTSPKKDSTPQQNSGIRNADSSVANPDKPNSTAEDNVAAMLPSDPKEAAAVSGGAALGGEAAPLGSILKGSPFEQDAKKGVAPSPRETGAAAEPTQSLEQQAKSPSTPMTNGKPNEAPAQKAGQPNSKIASRPSTVGNNPAAQPASSTKERFENKPQTSTFPAPITPKNAATPSEQPLPKQTPPKPALSQETKDDAPKDARKTVVERPSRPSVAPRAPTAASKPVPKPGKKPGPTSPPSFTKPRPRSPTRPVRLPGSATAPTAASAARLDAIPPPTAKSRDRVPPSSTSLRPKPARTSLPAGSKPAEKAPKSRLSTASSKAPEGSFLDRMMRPTQSSSQKTHEKVEAKTPPKKTSGVRPKRKSDASEKARSENAEGKGEPTESAPSTPVQAPNDSSEAPNANEAKKSIDEAAPASPAPVPSQ